MRSALRAARPWADVARYTLLRRVHNARAMAAHTLRPVPLSLPERAFSRVVFPEEGGPSSSVRRPGLMVPLRPFRMLKRFLVLGMILSRCSNPCRRMPDLETPLLGMFIIRAQLAGHCHHTSALQVGLTPATYLGKLTSIGEDE